MYPLLKKEISYFFSSLIGVVILVVFLLVNSLFLWMIPINEYLNIFTSGYASLEPLFTLAPWMYLILIPALTMRTIAEEKSQGTLELLLTKPISEKQLVLSKFLASLIILILTILPTFTYFISVYYLGYPKGNLDIGASIGSYLGLLLLGAVFIAIGIFASALSNNQIVSLLLSIVLCIFFYLGLEWITSFGTNSSIGYVVKQIGIQEHYYSISRGLIDTRDIVYFIVITVIFLGLSVLKISSRKW
jgi:ABC-2 type transport system permease protein